MKRSRCLTAATSIVLAVAFAAPLSACRERNTAADDARIAGDVRRELGEDDDLKGLAISVDAASGAVVLRGKVKTSAQRAEAERIAKGVGGVDNVTNQLVVDPTAGTPPVAAPPPAPPAQVPPAGMPPAGTTPPPAPVVPQNPPPGAMPDAGGGAQQP